MMQSVNWEGLSDSARVWVYTASRPLSNTEIAALSNLLNVFVADWAAHGKSLEAGWSLEVDNRVLVLAVDESAHGASGCSIDASVAFLKNVAAEFGDLDWFDRHIIMYQNEGEWQEARLHHFWALRKAGQIQPHTPLCDTLATNLGEWRRHSIRPFAESWHQEMWS